MELNQDERKALQNWFGIAKESSLAVTENLYKEGKLKRLQEVSEAIWKEKGISSLIVYRWETGDRKCKVLESWTPNQREALSYKDLRGEGSLLIRSVTADDVFMTTDLGEEFYWDEELGMMPYEEIIVKA